MRPIGCLYPFCDRRKHWLYVCNGERFFLTPHRYPAGCWNLEWNRNSVFLHSFIWYSKGGHAEKAATGDLQKYRHWHTNTKRHCHFSAAFHSKQCVRFVAHRWGTLHSFSSVCSNPERTLGWVSQHPR